MAGKIRVHEQRGIAMIKVYYNTSDPDSGMRRCRQFVSQDEAIAWAKKNADRNPAVVKVEETLIWNWKDGPVR
jgi:hypothetical protein